MKKNKAVYIFGVMLVILSVASVIGLAITGWKIKWGPFSFLHTWENDVSSIEEQYSTERKDEIIFYGASNFSLWEQLDEDLKEYGFIVQNHAFGGSTDEDLLDYADRLLYPYQPKIVVLQTGSNDYVHLNGTDEEKAETCMKQKKEMYETFHEQLPNTKIVIMSGLLLPGRSEYTELTKKINEQLEMYATEEDYLYYVNAENMTFDGTKYRSELFRKDVIHLNHDGELIWAEKYIVPVLEQLIQ